MRLATIVASALALVVASIDAVTVVAPSATHCFELPIVTLVPTKTPFPDKHCKQPPLPSENCLKAHVETDVHVIENKDVYGKPVLNCIGNASTSVYPSTSHFRGQSSLGFSKHQYSVKLHEAAPLLGFPEDRSFVLNGPVIDGSLIRNHLAQWLYRSTGRYSPRTRHIVLMVHDPVTNNLEYHGVYLALEQISYGPNRVGLAQLDNKCTVDQFNGGWAWQINPLNYGVYSPNIIFDQYELMFGAGERPVLMYPPKEDLTKSMRDYFVSTSTGPLPLLYRFLYDHADQPDKLEEYIDLGSFVDYMLHSELSQNSDAYRRSTYFFKDRDQPINAGPVWDFNLAFGTGNNQADWLFRIHFLWRRMLTNYKFVALTIKRWRTLRETVWKDESIVAFIDDAIAPLERQFVPCSKWHSEEMPCANVNKSGTFKSHVDRVKSAIQQRAKWMDENVVKFYSKIEKSQWAQATAGLPSYNCAADGEDDGCLTNPDKYINNVTIPAIRGPFAGPVCNATNPTEQTSIDPCWLSFGVGSTVFCSGSGYCGQGPGATCACSNGRLPPTCALPATQTLDASDMTSSNADKSSWLNGVVVLLTFGGVFGVLVTFKRRRHRTAKFTTDERTPLANQLKSKSQPSDQAVHAYGTRF